MNIGGLCPEVKLHLCPKEAWRRKSRSHAKSLNNWRKIKSQTKPYIKATEIPPPFGAGEASCSPQLAYTQTQTNSLFMLTHGAQGRCSTFLPCSWLRRGISEPSSCWLRHLSCQTSGNTEGSIITGFAA